MLISDVWMSFLTVRPSSYYMKTPPTQMRDSVAYDLTEAFVLDDKDGGSKRERTGRARLNPS